ncbi:MAG: type II secretion system F family protein [Novosphingobium sp.]
MIDIAVRLAVLLATFGSVFLLAQVVMGRVWRSRERYAAVNQRLQLIRRGASTEQVMATLRKNVPVEFKGAPPLIGKLLIKLQQMMFASGLPYTLAQVLQAMALLTVLLLVLFVLALIASNVVITVGTVFLAFILALIVGAALPMLVLSMRAQRRRQKIEDQFPVSLDIFVRALRSGHPVASAIELLTREMEDPIGSEFGLVSDEISFGAELTDAIEAMADRWDLEDLRMFVVSLSVQIETGGNLAEILENLAEVIRARASLYRKVRSLSAEGRMTGWMLTVLPLVTFVGMFAVSPEFYLDVSRDPIFMFGFPSLIILYFIGVFWIRSLVNIKV